MSPRWIIYVPRGKEEPTRTLLKAEECIIENESPHPLDTAQALRRFYQFETEHGILAYDSKKYLARSPLVETNISLIPLEGAVFAVLMNDPTRTVTHAQCVDELEEQGYYIKAANLTTTVHTLRAKLGDIPTDLNKKKAFRLIHKAGDGYSLTSNDAVAHGMETSDPKISFIASNGRQLTLYPTRRLVFSPLLPDGQNSIELAPLERTYLQQLMLYPNQIVSVGQLARAAARDERDPGPDPSGMKVYIRKIRNRLGDTGENHQLIHAFRGKGYSLATPESLYSFDHAETIVFDCKNP